MDGVGRKDLESWESKKKSKKREKKMTSCSIWDLRDTPRLGRTPARVYFGSMSLKTLDGGSYLRIKLTNYAYNVRERERERET